MIRAGSRLQILGRMVSVRAVEGSNITLEQPLEMHGRAREDRASAHGTEPTDIWLFAEQAITCVPNTDYQLLLHNMG